MKELSQKTIARIEKAATKVVSNTLGKIIAKKDLPGQVAIARKMIKLTGIVDFRATLLKDDGLPADIRSLVEKGLEAHEIKTFYWDCTEFQEFWTNDLECTEHILDELIEQALN